MLPNQELTDDIKKEPDNNNIKKKPNKKKKIPNKKKKEPNYKKEEPIIDENEEIRKKTFSYIQQTKDAYAAEIQNKYEIALLFINLVLAPNKIGKLTEFRKIEEDSILKNVTNNKRLIKKYSQNFKTMFSFKTTIDENTTDDKIDKKYIIKFIRLIVSHIGYVLTSKNMFDEKTNIIKKYYYIDVVTKL